MDEEQEYREEAERMSHLPREEQERIMDWHRDIASNPTVKKKDRQAALERAMVLEKLLGIRRGSR